MAIAYSIPQQRYAYQLVDVGIKNLKHFVPFIHGIPQKTQEETGRILRLLEDFRPVDTVTSPVDERVELFCCRPAQLRVVGYYSIGFHMSNHMNTEKVLKDVLVT